MGKSSFNSFFKNKTIFVTGHTGFQGSWLVNWLLMLGSNVVGYSIDIPTSPSMFLATHLEKKITHVVGDVRDFQFLNKSIQKYNPDIVFHLAAQPLVKRSYLKPLDTFSTNIQGTANVLESIRYNTKIKVCVIMTSDKCYDNRGNPNPHKEDDPMGGIDPYSASKGATELITSSYRDSFFNDSKIKISTVRAGNVLGGGDWAEDRIMPDCISALHTQSPITLRYPNAIRPWQHVLEVISGLLLLSMKMFETQNLSQSWNFGPSLKSKSVSVGELVDKIINYWPNSNTKILFDPDKKLHEESILLLDSSKAEDVLDWKSVLSFDEMVQITVDWYNSFYSNSDKLDVLTQNQILFYTEKMKVK